MRDKARGADALAPLAVRLRREELYRFLRLRVAATVGVVIVEEPRLMFEPALRIFVSVAASSW